MGPLRPILFNLPRLYEWRGPRVVEKRQAEGDRWFYLNFNGIMTPGLSTYPVDANGVPAQPLVHRAG